MAKIIQIDSNSIRNDTANSEDFVAIGGLYWLLHLRSSEKEIELHAECRRPDDIEYWISEVELKFGLKSEDDFNSEVVKHVKFTNCTNIYTITLTDQKFPFIYYAMSVDVKSLKSFEPEIITKWLIPVPNITDTILIVENQRIHVCKKYLAQYSTYFYELFYGDDASKDIHEYYIQEVTCYDFCIFLGLLYNQDISMETIVTLSELSIHFGADQCLEDCRKFLNKEKSNVPELSLIFKNIQDIEKSIEQMTIRELPGAEKFIHRGQPYPVETINIGCVPFEIIKERIAFCNNWNITISCICKDMENPWSCEVEIRGLINPYQPTQGYRRTCDDQNPTFQLFNIEFSPISIKVISTTGIFEPRSTAFTEIRPNLTDVVLSVGDKKYHVSKQILARSSTYFCTMFYSDFMEKDRDEIELKDIDSEEFEEFIQMVYHPSRRISEDNIEGLLKLSQMYDCQTILKKCEKILMHEKNINDAMKIKISEKFYLEDLYDKTIAKVKTFADLRDLSKLDGFDEISEGTIVNIKLNILKIKR